jgi:transposase
MATPSVSRMTRSSSGKTEEPIGGSKTDAIIGADRRVLFTKSRRVRSRVALALRMAANSLHHADHYLGEFFRRIPRKLGEPQAITATAHKLASIVFHLLSTKEPYQESVFMGCEEEAQQRADLRLKRQAARLGFQVIPAANA